MDRIKSKNRLVYIEYLRAVACLLVIMIHSTYMYVSGPCNTLNYYLSNLLDGLSRCAVPLFVMITGSLFLDESYAYSPRKLIKHIVRMIVFFVFWSALYCLVFNIAVPLLYHHQDVSISKVITDLVKGCYHLWYVYLVLGLYALTPIFRLWVKLDNIKIVRYYLIITFIFSFAIKQFLTVGTEFFGFLQSFSKVNSYLHIADFGKYMVYFVMGWYINTVDKLNRKAVYILGLSGACVTVLGSYLYSLYTGQSKNLYSYISVNVFFFSIAVFVFVKDRCKNKTKTNAVIKFISDRSLGVYAIHPLIINLLLLYLPNSVVDNALITSPMLYVASLTVSLAASWILGKIPLLKKLV